MPVYFIQEGEGGAIKIGTTLGSPMVRLAALQTGNSRKLVLLASIPGGPKEETELHGRFAALRLHGEWFAPDPRLLGFIEGLLYALPHERYLYHGPSNLHGFSPEQVQFMMGLIDGIGLTNKIDEAHILTGVIAGTDLLSPSNLSELVFAKYAIENVTSPEFPPAAAEMDGRLAASAERINKYALKDIDEALGRHNMAVAEQRLADAEVSGDESAWGAGNEAEACDTPDSHPLPHEVN